MTMYSRGSVRISSDKKSEASMNNNRIKQKKRINIFNQLDNEIHDSIDPALRDKLKAYYSSYHRLHVCYKWMYYKNKKRGVLLFLLTASLFTSSAVVGGVTANPIAPGILTGLGLGIGGYIKKTDLPGLVKSCAIAHKTYKNILTEIVSYLRGLAYDDVIFLSNMKVIEDFITGLCPPINAKLISKYNKKYCTNQD